jgi:hypothetical protein
VYTKVNIFSILLALKKQNVIAASFFVVMNILTFLVDKQVTKKFVKPGLTLAFTNARLVDEQNKVGTCIRMINGIHQFFKPTKYYLFVSI